MGLDAGAVLSFSRNDSIMSSLSHTSTEAEIKAVDELMREMIHLLDISRFCAGIQELPMKSYCDNQSAAALFETLKCSNKVKHINMRINFIREFILEGLFSIHFVPTHYNVADVLTKSIHFIHILQRYVLRSKRMSYMWCEACCRVIRRQRRKVNDQHKVCECWSKLSFQDRSHSGLRLATSPSSEFGKDFFNESFTNKYYFLHRA
jgi:hypothetical protein